MGADFFQIRIGEILNLFILLATIAAIVWGPVFALRFQAEKEHSAQAFRRKRDIAASLMKTRRMPTHEEHVGALNLIQLEFSDDKKVMKAFSKYISHLSEQTPQDREEFDLFLQRRRDLFFVLLARIGKSIGVNIERVEMDRMAYLPNGWNQIENEQKELRQSLIDVCQGRKPIYTATHIPPQIASRFPPPPAE